MENVIPLSNKQKRLLYSIMLGITYPACFLYTLTQAPKIKEKIKKRKKMQQKKSLNMKNSGGKAGKFQFMVEDIKELIRIPTILC